MHAPPTAAKCFDRSCLLIITLKLQRYRPTNRYNIDPLIRSLSVAFDEKISISVNNRTSIQIILVHATLKLIQSFDARILINPLSPIIFRLLFGTIELSKIFYFLRIQYNRIALFRHRKFFYCFTRSNCSFISHGGTISKS